MNALTIDFDIIMQPSIQLYNGSIDVPNSPVSKYIQDFPFLENNLPADLNRYSFLTRLVAEQCQKVPNIFFISQHNYVVDILDKYASETVNVINVDHHHDLGYDDDNQWTDRVQFNRCGNWAKYGRQKDIINSYIWVNNENSDYFKLDEKGSEKFLDKVYSFKEFSTQKLPNFDFLIICASYEWIPPIYQPLFTAWIGMCEEITKKTFSLDKF